MGVHGWGLEAGRCAHGCLSECSLSLLLMYGCIGSTYIFCETKGHIRAARKMLSVWPHRWYCWVYCGDVKAG